MTRKPGTADLTSLSGSATDVARVGRQSPPPPHEQTADEDSAPVDWERIAAFDEFKALLAAKRKFIAPATVFFIAYYFALPVLVGYAPGLMTKKVFGVVNVAYLFALSQFFVAWAVAALYVRAASGFDRMASGVLARFEKAEK
jgi:uncharacterized membrane protein (DUF485 family)